MSSGDGNRLVRNAAYRLMFPAFDTLKALVSAIGGSMAPVISQDSGTHSATTNTPSELASTGTYTLDLTVAEMTGDEVNLIITQATMVDYVKTFEFEPALDSGVAQAGGASSITLRAAAVATNDYYNGATVEIVRGTGAGQTRSIIDYAAGSLIATVDRAWAVVPDSTSVYKITSPVAPKLTADIRVASDVEAISGDTTAADKLEAVYEGLIIGSVNDGSPSTTSFVGDSALEASVDNFYDNCLLVFRDGPNTGITRKVTNYDESTFTFTVKAFPATPTNGDNFFLISDSS